MIKYYDTLAEYSAAISGISQSQVSRVEETRDVKFDGRKIVIGINSAKTGDIVLLDQNNALVFVPVEAYKASDFSNYTKVGVVFIGVDDPDFRGEIGIMNKNNAGQIWSYIYSYKLTGFTLDGTNRSGVLSVREASDSWAVNHNYTINYNATTVEDFVAQLNSYFTSNAPFTTQDWVAEADSAGNVTLTFHYVTWYQTSYNTASSGFAIAGNLLPDVITPNYNMLRKNGQRSGEGTITNWDRAIAYFSQDLNNSTFTPTSNVTSIQRGYPICLPAYLGSSSYQGGADRCAYLREYYGEGREGWLKFMENQLPVRPSAYASLAADNDDHYALSKNNTEILVNEGNWTGQDGNSHVRYPAANYCFAVSYNHELLGQGAWVLPDMDLVFAIVKHLKYGTSSSTSADPINKALAALGGNLLSNGAYVWSCIRSYRRHAWRADGDIGCAYYGHLCFTLQAVPVVLLKVNEVNS